MGNFQHIQLKLEQFIKKYYTNELIKGTILFVAFGLLYFIFTLLVEYFLWLRPTQRSILFYAFVLVELVLLVRYIVIPFARMLGLQNGITITDASRIIGKHFPEVDDKLLNVLQLNFSEQQSELLLASIDQRAANLQPIPFHQAIDFKGNIKYLKYLAIPLLIWFFIWISGKNFILQESLDRVVHYQIAYEPPAPFHFLVLNEKLHVIEGHNFDLKIKTVGDVIPENAEVVFTNQNYYLKDVAPGRFAYVFNNVKQPISFYIQANGIRSKDYTIDVIKIPAITGFEMTLDYPSYTGKSDEIIKNTGNATIPEGTQITWKVATKETDTVTFVSDQFAEHFQNRVNYFVLDKRIKEPLHYEISSSNKILRNYEKLNYAIDVVKDAYPKIQVKSDIDSITRGPVQFAGQLSDDYGVAGLKMVYYEVENEAEKERIIIPVQRSAFEEFYYVLSADGGLKIQPGKAYELFFEVFDNDGINGSKSTKSQVFSYYHKTEEEIANDLLKEQEDYFNELSKTSEDSEKLSKDLEELTKDLKNKPNLDWNDKKQLSKFLERQDKYQKMLQRQTENLMDNLEEQDQKMNDSFMNDQKEELIQRMQETKELQERNKLLEELQKMSEKLDKEHMLDKLEKLSQQQRQENRSLERLLELTKRFFIEKKVNQITQALDSLAVKQEKLSDQIENTAEEQEKLNNEFKRIQEELRALEMQNQELFEPMKLSDTNQDEEIIENLQKRAVDQLKNEDSKEVHSNDEENSKGNSPSLYQKAASRKMKQMGEKMKGDMSAMQMEMIDENIDNIKAILENLLSFSFDQEHLMLSLDGVDANSAEFPKKLKKQQVLKERFEHIDDSLYTLSLRVQKLSSNIQEHLTDTHYNIEKSLENIAENRVDQSIMHQQYTMTAANDMADLLSDLLSSLQNPNGGEGKGQQNQFTLPDIIKKQKGLGEMMQQQGKGEKKQGQGNQERQNNHGEDMNGELFRIYKEQSELRQALQDLLNNKRGKEGSKGAKALKAMEDLERELLEKGFTSDVMKQLQKLEYELLKLEEATRQQGEDSKRTSQTNTTNFEVRSVIPLKHPKLYFNSKEVLIRDPLPLRTNYKRKVQDYFKE